MRPTILLLTLAITACTASVAPEDIRDRDWTLVWVDGFPSLPGDVARPTLRFGVDGRLGGNTGCNTAGAAYTIEGDRLAMEAVIATKRACMNPEGNRLETAYLRAIQSAHRYRVTNGQLELLDENRNVLARFR